MHPTKWKQSIAGIIVLSLSIGQQSSACECVQDPYRAKAGAAQLAHGDLVFIGIPQRIGYKSPESWACEFYGEGESDPRNKLVVRVTLGACEPAEGAKVVVDGQPNLPRRVSYTLNDGVVAFWRLQKGEYEIKASAIGVDSKKVRISYDPSVGAKLTIGLAAEVGVYRTQFLVQEVLKGLPVKIVVVETTDNEAACGYGSFRLRERYEVFANKTSVEGLYRVDLCSGTRKITSR